MRFASRSFKFYYVLSFTALGLFIFILPETLLNAILPESFQTLVKVVGGFLILSGLLVFISDYLTGNINFLRYSTEDAFRVITSQIEKLREDISNSKIQINSSDRIDIEALSNSVREQALQQIPKKVVAELESKFSSKSLENTQVLLVRNSLSTTSERLKIAIEDLGRKSNTNLLIGIATTIGAAIGLGYTAFETKPGFADVNQLLAYYIPRVTTVIFIEIFAFFFLKLYRATLQEIKYFQNELTNVELKKVAFEAALIQSPSKPMEEIITQLMKTERNPFKISENPKDVENNLSVKDINSVIEVVGKVVGKGQ